ncbi:hypothetical protein PG996_005403 [Apiospora saccharicola]|uniref:Hydrophobin n=1 Tax=Apiospora saccharicola TaxID=335842 RepID=A0ABR1VLC5_9PEZI
MKLSILPSLLLATLATACVQEGRACAAGGDKCCLRRSCVSSTKGSALGFCVSLDAASLLNQPMPIVVPAAPAPAAPAATAPAAGTQPNNGGAMGEQPNNGNNGNGQAPAMSDGTNAGQPANTSQGMFPVGNNQGMNNVNQANPGNAGSPFYIVPTED